MEINLKTFALAVVLSQAVLSFARADVDVTALANSNNWRTLLHFRDENSGLSEIDEPSFFLSPEGRRDPRAELEATLHAFRQPPGTQVGHYQQHPRCAYPARMRLLKEHGFAHEFSATEVECAELNNWKKGLAVDAVALVYAAPYLGNPASMFGHTFLRLKSSAHPLVDASVSFDATPTSDGAVAFALKGLMGGYRGLFSQQPFYSKIKTYSEIENRGLWEYELNLAPAQIERLVEHVWEMGAASFDYYFFDENCSYQLLSLLEVAEPSWRLRERFGAMTIPLDTVRAVESYGGAVRATSFRESLVASLETRLSRLSANDRRAFEAVRETKVLNGDESVSVLDALLEWQKYQTANRAEGGAAFGDELETRILLRRSKMNSSRDEMTNEIENTSSRPEQGHASSKVSLGWARENSANLATLTYRPALHDRLDADLGYVPNSTLVIGRVGISYFFDPRVLAIDDVTFAEVENLRPMNEFHAAPSWVAGARVVRPRDVACVDCVAAQAQFGIGASVSIFRGHTLVSSLINLRAEDSNSFRAEYDQTFRFNPSFRVAALSTVNDVLKFEISGEYFQPFSRFDRASMTYVEGGAAVAISVRAISAELRASFIARTRHDQTDAEPRLAMSQYF